MDIKKPMMSICGQMSQYDDSPRSFSRLNYGGMISQFSLLLAWSNQSNIATVWRNRNAKIRLKRIGSRCAFQWYLFKRLIEARRSPKHNGMIVSVCFFGFPGLRYVIGSRSECHNCNLVIVKSNEIRCHWSSEASALYPCRFGGCTWLYLAVLKRGEGITTASRHFNDDDSHGRFERSETSDALT